MKTPFDLKLEDLEESKPMIARNGILDLPDLGRGYNLDYYIEERDNVNFLEAPFEVTMMINGNEFIGKGDSPEDAHLDLLKEIEDFIKALNVVVSWPRPESK